MSVEPDDRALVGRFVRLDVARLDDAAGLQAALDDERVWANYYAGGLLARPTDLDGWRAWQQRALDARAVGQRQAYVVRLLEDAADLGEPGTVVGTTSLGDWDLVNERAHIGWTAYGPPWWGSRVNAECKLLLLGYAFDDLGFGRVKIQTDSRNQRSQAAIAKLGATREGVLRRHMRCADGTWRDTVVFSVLVDEWPDVRAGLERRLGASG
jgi:RimJ/RimL family protein N-acetyltransferase